MSIAALRTDDSVNIALLVHVLGAMLLVGTLVVVVSSLVLAWRRQEASEVTALTRLGLRSLLVGVLPAYVVMRIGGQWVESEQNYPEGFEPGWLDVGYVTADIGGLLLVVSLVLSVFGLRRLGRAATARDVLGRLVAVVSALLLAAYVVAMWAMTTKPD